MNKAFKIKSVKNHSGHYLPRAEHIETLKGYLTDNLSLEDLAKIEWKILSDKVMNVVSSLQKIPFAYKIYQWFK